MRKVLQENESWKFLNMIILVAAAIRRILRSTKTYTDVENLRTVTVK